MINKRLNIIFLTNGPLPTILPTIDYQAYKTLFYHIKEWNVKIFSNFWHLTIFFKHCSYKNNPSECTKQAVLYNGFFATSPLIGIGESRVTLVFSVAGRKFHLYCTKWPVLILPLLPCVFTILCFRFTVNDYLGWQNWCVRTPKSWYMYTSPQWDRYIYFFQTRNTYTSTHTQATMP